MDPATVARLYNDVPQIVAIKEATGSLDIAQQIKVRTVRTVRVKRISKTRRGESSDEGKDGGQSRGAKPGGIDRGHRQRA